MLDSTSCPRPLMEQMSSQYFTLHSSALSLHFLSYSIFAISTALPSIDMAATNEKQELSMVEALAPATPLQTEVQPPLYSPVRETK